MPPVNVESAYLKVFATEKWPNGLLASASDLKSPISGRTGVKMSGPYQWVPPVYWLQQTPESHPPPAEQGGAWGFLSEGGPGAAPMTWESLNATVVDMWPIDSIDMNYHGMSKRIYVYLCKFVTVVVAVLLANARTLAANPEGFFGKGLQFFTPALFGQSVNARLWCIVKPLTVVRFAQLDTVARQ